MSGIQLFRLVHLADPESLMSYNLWIDHGDILKLQPQPQIYPAQRYSVTLSYCISCTLLQQDTMKMDFKEHTYQAKI